MTLHSVLTYDADCAFCTRCAGWISARGVDVVRSHSVDVMTAGITAGQLDESVWWLDGSGRAVLGGARAIAQALRVSGGWRRPLGVLIDLPPVRPLAALLYRWISRNRHRLPGGSDQCRLP